MADQVHPIDREPPPMVEMRAYPNGAQAQGELKDDEEEEDPEALQLLSTGDIVDSKKITVRPSESSSRGSEGSWLSRLVTTQCHLGGSAVVSDAVCAVLVTGLTWAVLYLLLDGEVSPAGGLFKLISLVIVASIVGAVVSRFRLPGLLGMLLTGILFRSVGYFNVSGVYLNVIEVSREISLTVILIKAGLGLDAGALRKNFLTVIKLAVCPCVTESVAAAIVTHYCLGFDWLWGFLLGFLLSPISPAVVVPTLLKLKSEGYGEDKGISTMVIAASSVDDILSISLFGVFISMLFDNTGTANIYQLVLKGPEELLIGLAVGALWGLVCAIFPKKDDSMVGVKRTVMLGLGGLCAILGSERIGFAGAGPLGAITAAFTAGVAWKSQGWSNQYNPVAVHYSGIWLVVQPILFALIGTEIDLRTLNPINVANGLMVVFCALLVRIGTCSLILLRDKLTLKEVLFVNLAWLPKATVQAALSPQPLERVRSNPNSTEQDYYMANLLLSTAVLAILITAPLGSIGITLSGPRLLNKPHPNIQPQI